MRTRRLPRLCWTALLITACEPGGGKAGPASDSAAVGDSAPAEDTREDTAAPLEPSDAAVEELAGTGGLDLATAVFDPDAIHDIELTLDAGDWADIYWNPWAETWHTADFAWDDETVGPVGVRAFGYSSHVAGKPPLKIDFNREIPGQRWRGLECLKLRNAYYDASFMHDALGPWMLRRAGVPASRTGWARVWANGALIGFYTVMECIDDRFLKANFGNDDGPLYSIDGIRGHGLMPLTDALAYFQYNTSVTGDGADLEDLTRIVAEGSDEALAAVLDVDSFFDESIVRTLSGSQDSFSADGNNFYLYNDPGVDADPDDLHGLWRVIPWDYNFDFTSLSLVAALTVDPKTPWTTSTYAFDPYSGEPYTDVLMARQVAGGRDVDARVAELLTGELAYADVVGQVEAWRALIADEVAADPLGGEDRFAQGLANDLLYLHMRWSNALSAEVADCAPLEDDAVLARDLSPTGTVGWASLTTDGWIWAGAAHDCVNVDAPCVGFDIAATHYCTGLYAHAPSSVTLTIPDGMTSLRGAVGLQLFAEDCSNGVTFTVSQGGAALWTSGVQTSYSEAEDMGDVAVAPGAVLLLADPMGDYGCDTAAWVDLRAVP